MEYTNPAVGKTLSRHSQIALSFLSLTLFFVCSFLILSQSAQAQQLFCNPRFIQQITDADSGNSIEPSINADGGFVAFESRADLTGDNPLMNNEIFLANTKTKVITQITESAETSRQPSINGDGTRIAFQSSANFTGGNGILRPQIFMFDTTTSTFTQFTSGPSGSTGGASIDSGGTRIAFRSNGNINGGNPDFNTEVYFVDTATGVITQVTDTVTGSNNDPQLSGDGTRIAFRSTANITGGNPDGNLEIFLFDITTATFTQITFTTGSSFNTDPSINGDGMRIAFRRNIGPGNQIVIFDTTAGMITEVTEPGNVNDPTIDAPGTRVAFRSNGNINGQNPGGFNQIWVFDSTNSVTTSVTNITSGGGFSERPSINADGTRIAFESTSNINGGNPDQTPDQIYVATCLDPMTARNIPTLSEWGLIAMAGVLGIIGLLALRRRKATA